MSVNYPTKLLLAYRSGNKCALPNCGCELSPPSESGDPINVGVAAHIAGERPGSARYDLKMTKEERNHYNNLIYLCGNCHTKIDAIPQGETDYPEERLLQIKTKHEQKVQDGLAREFADVGFQELEEVTQWISQIPRQQPDSNFLLITPEEKIRKNDLSNKSRRIVTMGLGVTQEVKAFVESMAQTDPDFPERLKVGFLQKYYSLKQEGHFGDDLFDLMCQFAQQGFREVSKQVASLAVLIYLFEACEVFEK